MCNHLQETSNRGEHVSRILPPAKVDRGPQGDVARQRQTRADGEAGYDKARHVDERDDAHGPPKADDGYEFLKYDREDDSPARAASCCQPDGKCASSPEPVSENCDRRIEATCTPIRSCLVRYARKDKQHSQTNPEQDSMGEENLVCLVVLRERHHHQ